MSDPFFQIFTDRAQQGDIMHPESLERRLQNPVCQKCVETYKKKFPGRPFGIKCEGIFSEQDFEEIHQMSVGTDSEISVEEVRELLNPVAWSNKYIRLQDRYGDLQPFVARWYQAESLQCTANRKIDRWGRGLGKSQVGAIEELHKAFTRKNHRILIACPAKAQAESWYNELVEMIDRSPDLRSAVSDKKQAPYYVIHFRNGSKISIFTTGSTSGKQSDTLRGQSPRRIRIDEQDLLNEPDYKAIMPLLRRFPELEFHGSSTPTGKREAYWDMCVKFPDYKELHFPIMVHPDWSPEMEIACRREARTETVYEHEFLAEFGDLEAGVFKAKYIDAAKKPYTYQDAPPAGPWKCFMGVDWNGRGTGTRVRIVGYNPETEIRRVLWHQAVDASTLETIQTIRQLNKHWKCEEVWIDHGFGNVQDELLRLIGKTSSDPYDRRLLDIKTIDFGATLTTNRLVPRRDNVKYSIDPEDNELERRTKVFMVEGAVMAFEEGKVEFSYDDPVLEEQMRGYRVKSWSDHGFPSSYVCQVGDHDLDALMLALLGIEIKYGLFRKFEQNHRTLAASIQMLTGVGGEAVPASGIGLQAVREAAQRTSGVASRTPDQKVQPQVQVHYSSPNPGGMIIISSPKGGGAVVPSGRGGVPSRTGMFGPGGRRGN